MKNYYNILGLSASADKKAIRKAWLQKAKVTHPDHNPDDPTSEELFKEAQEAYRILSDPFLKSRYDSGMLATKLTTNYDEKKPVNYYFYSKTKFTSVKQYDEFTIQFSYIGKGRLFKKPSFNNFFVTGSPYVSHRLITHEEHTLKETTFTYMLCALKTGHLTIDPAYIKINETTLKSEPITIEVFKNQCHFSNNNEADGKPLKVIVHFDDQNYSGYSKRNHTLLIPRSRNARSFHIIGMIMKVVFIIWGGIMLSYYLNVSFIAGCILGGLLGGINCSIMYYIAGIKSKFKYARSYPEVKEYLDKGYKLGENSGTPVLNGSFFYNFYHFIF